MCIYIYSLYEVIISLNVNVCKGYNILALCINLSSLPSRYAYIYSCIPYSLKQLLVALDKKISKNQQLRAKYYNEPEKFIESELDLYTALTDLQPVAASPELYPIIVANQGVKTILGMYVYMYDVYVWYISCDI